MTTIQLSKLGGRSPLRRGLLLSAFFLALIALPSFAVKPPAGPTITQATGYLSNKTLIITGTNLSGATVNVDNANLTVTSNTSTTINADLPAMIGPGSYRLRVSTSGGIVNMDLALDNGDLGNNNTAKGDSALAGLTTGIFNDAFGHAALLVNTDGFSNNALGDSALFFNIHASQNTAIGDIALAFNDSSGNSLANSNVAVGAATLFNNVDGSENTAVGTGAGPNIVDGFNNTYLGDFVGTDAPDESSVIRIGDLSNGNGTGSLACFIGGIFNNFQPVGGSVVEVTLDLATDELGWDVGPSNRPPSTPVQRGVPVRRSAPVGRGVPVPRSAPGTPTQRPAISNGSVGKVEKLEATVAQQQKQIETLTAQLKEQAAQIQKVSAQVEVSKHAPQVVDNNR